jgi:hypothetical protein
MERHCCQVPPRFLSYSSAIKIIKLRAERRKLGYNDHFIAHMKRTAEFITANVASENSFEEKKK